MPKHCTACGKPIDAAGAFCPHCGVRQNTVPLQEPAAPIQENLASPQNLAPPEKFSSKKPWIIGGSITGGVLLLILFAVLLAIGLPDDGLENERKYPLTSSTQSGRSSTTPEETSSPETSKSNTDLQTLIDSGQAKVYGFYIQNDPQFDIETYRTLMPQGWTAAGEVAWNYQSATSPAMYVLDAKSPDGKAGVQVISDMYYSEEYRNGQPTQSTLAQVTPPKVQITPQQAATELLDATTGLTFTDSKNLDTSGQLKAMYENMMAQTKTDMQSAGTPITDYFITATGLTGTGTINGTLCDVYVEICMVGYTFEVRGSLFTLSCKMWGIVSTNIYYAPAGTLAQYKDDMDAITGNLTVNQNWLDGRNIMRDEINRRIREQQLADWAAARALSAQLSAHVDSVLNHTSNYSATGNSMDNFSDYMFDRNNYDMGGGEVLKVDTKWDHVWMDGGGNVITSNDSLFNPNTDIPGTGGYNELNRK